MTDRPTPPNEQTLLFAVFADQVARVRQMLDAGAAPDGAVGDPVTPLMESVDELEDFYDFGRLEMTRLLLAAGADVHRADPDGRTALHYAAGAGRQAVDALVAAGAQVDAVDLQGRTALHEAAERECVSVIEALRDGGAQVIADSDGRTPAEIIDRQGLEGDALARVDRALREITNRPPATRQPDSG